MNKVFKNILMLTLIVFIFIGCSNNSVVKSEQESENFKKLSPKEQVSIVHLVNKLLV